MRKDRAASRAVVAISMVLVALAATSVPKASVDQDVLVVHVRATYGEYVPEELLARSDAVAVIRVMAIGTARWNSATNQPWALDEIGLRSHIYTDTPVEVVRPIEGVLPEEFWVRGVGGRVGGVRVIYDEQPVLEEGREYLAVLAYVDTPMETGTEGAWTFVWSGHGLFAGDGKGGWINPMGVAWPSEHGDVAN
jgi:hypothetical protein